MSKTRSKYLAGMNKFLGKISISLLVIGLASSLSACSPVAEEPPVNPNAEACQLFEVATWTVKDERVEHSIVIAQFDSAALAGEGDVKSRIQSLISKLPNPYHMIYLNSSDYDLGIDFVTRACAAEDIKINPKKLELKIF